MDASSPPSADEANGVTGWAAAIADVRAPSLELLLARGRRHLDDWNGFEHWLLEAFSVERQADWPSAPFEVLGHGRAPGDAYWCHAEPLQLQAERSNVGVAPVRPEPSDGEMHALLSSVNEHFGEALRIESLGAARARRCYASLAAPPEGAPRPPRLLRGRIEPDAAPIGWHRLMNELQMLLHEHPVNEAREARGEAPVSSFWLWGGGSLAATGSSTLHSVVSEEPLSQGLARAADLRHSSIPRRFDAWLEQCGNAGVHLFVLDGLMQPSAARDPARWKAALAAIEDRVAAPVLEALRSNRIGMVTVHATSSRRVLAVENTRSDLRHFWRRPRPLARQPIAG